MKTFTSKSDDVFSRVVLFFHLAEETSRRQLKVAIGSEGEGGGGGKAKMGRESKRTG